MTLAPRPAFYRTIVDQWISLLNVAPVAPESMASLLEDLAVSVCRSVAQWIDVRAIDEKIASWSRFELEDVREAMQLLVEAPSEPEARQHDRQGYLATVATTLDTLENSQSGRGETNLSDDTFPMISRALEKAVAMTSRSWNHSPLIELAKRRIAKLRRSELRRLWGKIVNECDLHAPPKMVAEDGRFLIAGSWVVKPNFFIAPTDDKDLVDRIARYVSWIRPQLVAEMESRNRKAFFSPPFGLAKALSLVDDSSLSQPSEVEWTIARALGTLVRVTRMELTASSALSLDDAGPILSRFVKRQPGGSNSREHDMLFALSMLLTASEELLGASPAILEALRRYKLSVEVSTKEILHDRAHLFRPSRGNEASLQLDICRFLLSLGIYAVGTKFGNNQTDLVVSESEDVHLIEAKLYKKPPTAKQIMGHLPQLMSYAEGCFRLPPKTKTLLVFNRSDVLLVAPRTMLAGEYILVFVNLLDAPPNERKKHRHFRCEDGQLVADDFPSEARPRRSRSRRRR